MGDRSDVEARLRAEGLDAGAWSNGPHDRYAAHDHGYDKVLVCAPVPSGSACPRRARAPTSARAIAWSCRPAPRTTRRSGPTA